MMKLGHETMKKLVTSIVSGTNSLFFAFILKTKSKNCDDNHVHFYYFIPNPSKLRQIHVTNPCDKSDKLIKD